MIVPDLVKTRSPDPAGKPANHVYYFEVGLGGQEGPGVWAGDFLFNVTDWRKFWDDPIGLKNRFLVISMAFLMKLIGRAKIDSTLEGFPDRGEAGVATNLVLISKFGITLYRLEEEYILHPDGRQVQVQSQERFGPIPYLFKTTKKHPAEILDGGMRSVYDMPLLGTRWIARYTVRADRQHIDSLMACD